MVRSMVPDAWTEHNDKGRNSSKRRVEPPHDLFLRRTKICLTVARHGLNLVEAEHSGGQDAIAQVGR